MANKINHLIDAFQRLTQQAENCVLATIIETFSSTYQKAGARMLITTEGELIGLLGGGCFERDLVEQALTVFESGSPKSIFYDMRSSDDIIWGLGLGCNGAVRVFLQLLKAEDNFAPLNKLIDAAENNARCIMVTVVDSEHHQFPAGYTLFVPTFTTNNRQLLSSAPFPFTNAALQTIEKQKPHIESHVINSQTIKAFYEPIHPPLRLLILGAGADAIPLTQFAKLLGWRITVVDHRPGYIIKDRFPNADQLLYRTPDTIHDDLAINQFNALIVMTHNIEYDQRYLKAIVNCEIPFVGLLGPVHRKIKLLQSLGNDASKISSRVFGPVGLDIGAETPEEIALSIMAGIHAELNKCDGLQLNGKCQNHLYENVQR
jgi:xanthine/CO dehydrogenase XdhC/CoxF family maturation factor